MSEYPPEAWRRLARLLRSRRVNISDSYRNRTTFCAATGLNYKLVADIEGAPDTRTNFSDEYFALLEAGYRLSEGAIRRALEGAALEPRIEGPAEPPQGEVAPPAAVKEDPLTGNAAVEAYFQELTALVNERLTQVTQELADTREEFAEQRRQFEEQGRQLDQLRRELRQRDDSEQRKGA